MPPLFRCACRAGKLWGNGISEKTIWHLALAHLIHGRISLRSLVRLWFAPSSEVPIYRQLVTQVVLAILSGDVRPGSGFRARANWRVALRSIPTRSAQVIGNWNVKAGPNGAMGAVSMFASTPTRPPRRNRFWISISPASFALFASSACLRQSFAHVWPNGLSLHRQITCC